MEAFQTRLFGAASTYLPATGGNFEDHEPLDYAGKNAVDELGYYPDGVKRTLTDDQIAMFRHSEIYSILRERQIRKECSEADGVELSEGRFSDDEEVRGSMPPDQNGKISFSTNTDSHATQFKKIAQNDGKDLNRGRPGKNKRPRYSADFRDRQSQGHTFRRTARELDSVMADHQILDYGDEPSDAAKEYTAAQDSTSMVSSSSSVPAEHVSSATDITESLTVNGRKIWWPTIGN